MKVFTSMMKAIITIVSLALAVMLVTSIAPIMMGGLEVETTEDLKIEQDGSNLSISGKLLIKSSLPKDITDLNVRIDAVSLDDDDHFGGVKIWSIIDPITIESGEDVPIVISGGANIAELIVFILADNSENTGMYLPIQLSVSAGYGGLAGFNMKTLMVVELSESGSITGKAWKNNDGDIYSASASFSGSDGDMILDLIPEGEISAELSVEGDETNKIKIDIKKIGNDVNVVMYTGDGKDSIGLIELAEQMLDSGEPIFIGSDQWSGMTLLSDQVEQIKNYLSVYLGGITDVQ